MSVNQIIPIECRSARDFVNRLDPSNDLWTNKNWRSSWIFRGQGNANWRLVPAAHREEKEGASEQIIFARNLGSSKIQSAEVFLQEAYEHVKIYEKHHALNFLIQLYAEIANLREFVNLTYELNLSGSIPNVSDFHLFGTRFAKQYIKHFNKPKYINKIWGTPTIAIAQHHGVSTRLLDWTKHPLYAAFFAADSVPKDATHIAVYAVHSFYLRDEIKLIDVSKSHSPYIASQEGVFTLDTEADIEFLRTGVWRSVLDASIGDIYKITLPVSQLKELTRILWHNRVTKAHMMPILDNVIVTLNRKWKWQLVDPDEEK